MVDGCCWRLYNSRMIMAVVADQVFGRLHFPFILSLSQRWNQNCTPSSRSSPCEQLRFYHLFV